MVMSAATPSNTTKIANDLSSLDGYSQFRFMLFNTGMILQNRPCAKSPCFARAGGFARFDSPDGAGPWSDMRGLAWRPDPARRQLCSN
jgi:hypothetical protein